MLINVPADTKSWKRKDKDALEKVIKDTMVNFVDLVNRYPEKSLRLQIVEVGGNNQLH